MIIYKNLGIFHGYVNLPESSEINPFNLNITQPSGETSAATIEGTFATPHDRS